MFSPEFQERLAKGKYTNWACDLNEEQLAALLWAVGECGYRRDLIDARLDGRKLDAGWEVEMKLVYPRAKEGLDVVFEFARGQRHSVDEVRRRMRAAIDRARASFSDAGGTG